MHFTDKMPAQLRRGHAKGPEWTGDRRSALIRQRAAIDAARRKGKKRLPAPSRDMNFIYSWKNPHQKHLGGNYRCRHWRRPVQNNYRFILEPGATKARRMTARELVRTTWTDDEVARWRRTSDPDSARPETYGALAKVAHDVDVYIAAEWKTVDCGHPIACAQFVAEAHAADHPPWAMGLNNLPAARAKSENLQAVEIDGVSGQFALIFGRLAAIARKPKDWASWKHHPTRIWSRSRRLRAWLH